MHALSKQVTDAPAQDLVAGQKRKLSEEDTSKVAVAAAPCLDRIMGVCRYVAIGVGLRLLYKQAMELCSQMKNKSDKQGGNMMAAVQYIEARSKSMMVIRLWRTGTASSKNSSGADDTEADKYMFAIRLAQYRQPIDPPSKISPKSKISAGGGLRMDVLMFLGRDETSTFLEAYNYVCFLSCVLDPAPFSVIS